MAVEDENRELKRRLAAAEALLREKAAQDADLRESETRHRLLVESWAHAVWETDAAGVVVVDSPSWRAYTGQTLEEWLGYGWLDAIHPDDRAYAERQWREAVEARALVNADFRLRAPDGGWRWTNVRAAPVIDDAGNIEKWAGINIDIEERKRAEAALRESEMLRLVAVAGGRMGTWNWDLDARTCGGDAQFMALWGFPPSDDPRPLSAYTDRMTPVGAAQMEEIVTSAIAAGEEFDGPLEIVAGPRAGHWIRWRGRATAGFPRMLHGVTFDITEQKRAEEQLRESEDRQTFLLKLSDALRPLGDSTEIQAVAARLLNEHLGVMRVQYHWPAADSGDTLISGAGFTTGAPLVDEVIHFASFGDFAKDMALSGTTKVEADITRDPRVGPAQLQAYEALSIRAYVGVWLVKSGKLAAVLAVHEDQPRQWTAHEVALIEEVAERTWAAVERARVEAALRESEERRDLALEATQMGTFVWHVREDRGEPDARMLALFDQPSDGGLSLQTALATMIHPDDGARYAAAVAESSRPEGSRKLQTDIRVRCHDGTWRWLEIRARVSFGEDGQPLRMAGTALDITDRKQAEQALRDSEERLKLLVAELQHRVRNILTVIRLTFSRTFAGEGSKQELADHFLGRLGAMARTQVALTRHADRTANLEDLIRNELLSVGVHADGGPVTLSGPEVELDHKTAESLAMVLHELTTNALKYGAIAAKNASLSIIWRIDTSEGHARLLELVWLEQGVPAITIQPARRGFGRELIEEALPYQLGAETNLEFKGGGVRCSISIPLGKDERRPPANERRNAT